MWYPLEVTLFYFHVILSQLQQLRCKSVGNEPKLEVETKNNADGPWKTPGLRETFILIAKGLTVEWGKPNYEWVYDMQQKLGHCFAGKIPPRGDIGSANGRLDICKRIMGSSRTWPDRLYDNHYIHTASFNKPLGLLFGTGEHCKRVQRLTLKLLYQFEFFKASRMESFISYEISEIEPNLRNKIGQHGGEYTLSTHGMFQISSLNTVWQLIAGKRFAYNDPVAHEMIDSWNKANREQSIGFTILEILPFLKYFPRLTFFQSTQHMSNIAYYHFRKRLQEMREDRQRFDDHEVEPTNLTEGFLQELDKPENRSDPHLTEENMLDVMRDMMMAGSDTVNSALEFALYYMAVKTEIQDTVRAEIDHVIGISATPSFIHKDRMPFTQAVLQEVLRISSPVPCTGRTACKDVEVEGKKFPKGTFIAINIYALHRDESVWEDPFDFKPERFLDSDGKLVNFEKILVFGYCKRSCTGESVARVSLFLFFVTLMQRFTFELSKKHCLLLSRMRLD